MHSATLSIHTSGWARQFLIVCLLALAPAYANAAFDDGARYAFTASAEGRSVAIIDLRSRKQAGTISLELRPDAVVASEALKALIVAHTGHKALTLVDLMSEDLVKLHYPLDIEPDDILLSPIGETIAVYDREQAVLEVHALKRKAVLLRAENVKTEQPFTFSLDGSEVFWVDAESGTLRAVDLWSDERSVSLGEPGAKLSSLTRSIDGLLGFVSDADRNVVHAIDMRAFEIIRTLPVGAKPGRAWGSTDGRYMLVPNRGDGTITTINVATLSPQYTVAASANPVSVNLGWLDTTAAIVGADGEITFLDVATGRVTGTLSLPDAALAGVVTSDTQTLAVPVPAKGSMTLFDLRKRSKVGDISGLPQDIGSPSLAISNNLCH